MVRVDANATRAFVLLTDPRARTEPATNGNNKILSFSGDAEDEEEDPAVDLFAEASKPDADADADDDAGEGEGEDGDGDEAEPEDDFNAAWEVLDLARAIYEKRMNGDDLMRLRAADTFIMLGDISLETGASSNSPAYALTLNCYREIRTGNHGL
jgi:hypothetical protein